ncbi:MAG: Gfo/Idh/MocA family protein [Planctomycetota bacterium]|jgi:predicted dehydrogenase
MKTKVNRRDFLRSTATTAAAFTIVPRHVLGGPGHTPPSEKLNIAGIGAGGRGGGNINACSSENIVALCDVDDEKAKETFEKFPQVKKYRDFRQMLEKEDKNIDAVIVSTPDHVHAVASMMAIKMGKHVYCEKPLTHSVYEARMLTEAARKYKVATQMGNQGRSGEGTRLICEWIWAGAIGDVREVHAWTDRPIWPQGIDRPEDVSPVPPTLDWDLWLGPAPYRPYVEKVYCPFVWRGWWDFGTGALGDMACHIIDPVFLALKLGHPTSIRAVSTPVNSETAPLASIVEYEFPARAGMPPVKLTWYDGELRPTDPEELEPGRRMGSRNGGALFVGDKGKLVCGCYGKSPRLIPESKMQTFERPPKTIPRVEGHREDWIQACKGGKPACSNFDYAGPLTEVVVLGNLAIRTRKKLDWDGPNMKCTNVPEANDYVRRQYRAGWTL